jgi:hypothetical protein
MALGDVGELPRAQRTAARQAPMRPEGLAAGTDRNSDAHGIGDINVFTLNIWLAEPVDGFAGGRLVECILQRADMHLRPVEVRQMQGSRRRPGTKCPRPRVGSAPKPARRGADGFRSSRFALAGSTPNNSTLGRSARRCVGARRRYFGPSPGASAFDPRAGRCSRRQARSPQSRVRQRRRREIGWPFFDGRVRKQPRQLVHAARDDTHGGSRQAQLGREMNAGRAGGANNRNLRHYRAPMPRHQKTCIVNVACDH